MPRLVRYSKPYATRFKKEIEKKLLQFCLEHEVGTSEVMQAGVECLVKNEKCNARRRIIN